MGETFVIRLFSPSESAWTLKVTVCLSKEYVLVSALFWQPGEDLDLSIHQKEPKAGGNCWAYPGIKLNVLRTCYSKHGPWTCDITITWELVRKRQNLRPYLGPAESESAFFTRSPGDPHAHESLRSALLWSGSPKHPFAYLYTGHLYPSVSQTEHSYCSAIWGKPASSSKY